MTTYIQYLKRYLLRAALRVASLPGIQLLPVHPRRPVFVVGYNNSGKSTLVSGLEGHQRLKLFPGEGNELLWFEGFYPWRALDVSVPPLWLAPEEFVGAVLSTDPDRLDRARMRLGVYQLLRARKQWIVNDSGMLAALAPRLLDVFRDARILHVVRDGRVVSTLAAHKTMRSIEAHPDRYRAAGCPLGFRQVLSAQARYWCWIMDQIERAAEMTAGQVFQVRYEDWCAAPGDTLASILRFLELSDDSRRTGSRSQISNRNPAVLDRLSSDTLQMIVQIQSRHLRRYGY